MIPGERICLYLSLINRKEIDRVFINRSSIYIKQGEKNLNYGDMKRYTELRILENIFNYF